jgi:cytochrome c2
MRPIVLIIGAAVVIAAGLGAVAYKWTASQQHEEAVAIAFTNGDPRHGPPLIRRYGCGGCHTISAVSGADGKVAAPLDQLRKRVFIGGGVIRNTPENLVHWIVSPRALSPKAAMPQTGINETEARDVAAFLYAH